MEKSEEIKDLLGALSKAQGQIEGAKKDTENPFFKKKYADLAAVWDVARKPLSSNGLAVIQLPGRGEGVVVSLETVLTHSSGQWISSTMEMVPVKSDPQGVGSCLSYLRRYSLASVLGIFQEDDDGNSASHPPPSRNGSRPKEETKKSPPPSDFKAFLSKMEKAKSHLGEESYYKFLAEMTGINGEVMEYKHANQITKREQQESAYQGLLALAGVSK